MNPNYKTINAEAALADPDSVFWYLQKADCFAQGIPGVRGEGDFTLLEEEHPNLFVYRRGMEEEQLLVVCNFGGGETCWPLPAQWQDARVLISNYPNRAGALRPWEAMILYRAL